MKRLLKRLYLRWLEEELAAYREDVFGRPWLTRSTQDTYCDQADRFVRWVKGRFVKPLTDDEL